MKKEEPAIEGKTRNLIYERRSGDWDKDASEIALVSVEVFDWCPELCCFRQTVVVLARCLSHERYR